jgi:hypothetical protein
LQVDDLDSDPSSFLEREFLLVFPERERGEREREERAIHFRYGPMAFLQLEEVKWPFCKPFISCVALVKLCKVSVSISSSVKWNKKTSS